MNEIFTGLIVRQIPIDKIHPYARNPRRNDNAVKPVAESIRRFGFRQPIVVDGSGTIICGHTRYRAAKELGLETVPVAVADDLTEEQAAAYRLADNKTNELAVWDEGMLRSELQMLETEPMTVFGFEPMETVSAEAEWFENRNRFDNDGDAEESEEYQKFVEKFQPKKTTDDCYTPDAIYDAVADWVAEEYGLDRKNFVRPFYPGGDYAKRKYQPDEIVVDNPPFSILSEIVHFYTDKKIRFFLFAPMLTAFSGHGADFHPAVIAASVAITYENGAVVRTSFTTNLEPDDVVARTAPSLTKAVQDVVDRLAQEQSRSVSKYIYPDHIVTSAMIGRWSEYGVDYSLRRSDCTFVRALDAQRQCDKVIFGGGYLLSERAAAERAAAERLELSEREWEIVRNLGTGGESK